MSVFRRWRDWEALGRKPMMGNGLEIREAARMDDVAEDGEEHAWDEY